MKIVSILWEHSPGGGGTHIVKVYRYVPLQGVVLEGNFRAGGQKLLEISVQGVRNCLKIPYKGSESASNFRTGVKKLLEFLYRESESASNFRTGVKNA